MVSYRFQLYEGENTILGTLGIVTSTNTTISSRSGKISIHSYGYGNPVPHFTAQYQAGTLSHRAILLLFLRYMIKYIEEVWEKINQVILNTFSSLSKMLFCCLIRKRYPLVCFSMTLSTCSRLYHWSNKTINLHHKLCNHDFFFSWFHARSGRNRTTLPSIIFNVRIEWNGTIWRFMDNQTSQPVE